MLVALGLLAAACNRETVDEVKVSFDKRTPTIREVRARSVKLAVAAMLTPSEGASQYAALANAFGRAIGKPIQLVHGRTYSQVNDLLLSGKLQLAFICTGGYLELLERSPLIEVLAVPMVDGKLTYRSYVIVREGGRERTFADLEGQRFAFTDPLSNTGFLYPQALLRALGQDKDRFFSSYIFTGSHDRAIRAVQRGIRDAAAVDSLVFEYLRQRAPGAVQGLHVLTRSPEYGIPPVVAGPKTSAAQRRRWRAALLELHRRSEVQRPMAQLRIERFVAPPAGLYESAKTLRREAR